MRDVQSDKEAFESVIPPKRGGFKPRGKQLEICADFIRDCLSGGLPRSAELVVLPTGYGKTFLGILVFVILRHFKLANRLLVVVPSENLVEQYLGDIRRLNEMLDLGLSWCHYTNTTGSAKDCARASILVATYQTLQSPNSMLLDQHIMVLGASDKWMGIFEECHRLGEDGLWKNRLAGLRFAFTLLLTATPLRSDLKPIYGLTYDSTGRPFVRPGWCVTYLEAAKANVVRWIYGHRVKYSVNASIMGDNGQPKNVTLTTDSLKDGDGDATFMELLAKDGLTPGEVDKFEVRRKVRYHTTYLSPILEQALSRRDEKSAITECAHQIIIFTVSVLHARAVAESINAIKPGFADYVGESAFTPEASRTPEENKAILRRFRDGRLLCLVHVAKAGEGFDCPAASIGVFLHLTRSETRLVQEIGRVGRRWGKIKHPQLDSADVFASSDHPVLDVVESMTPRGEIDMDPPEPPGPGGEPRVPTLPDIIIVRTTWTGTDELGLDGKTADADMSAAFRWAQSALGDEQARTLPVDAILKLYRSHPGIQTSAKPSQGDLFNGDIADQRQAAEEQVKKNVGSLASYLLRRMIRDKVIPAPAGAFYGATLGKVMAVIHARYKKESNCGGVTQEGSGIAEYVAKNRWLQALTVKLSADKELPEWLVSKFN